MKTTIINAVAPTRICDVGGWTDTRFAGSGAVFNIAIYPYVEIQIHSLTPEINSNRGIEIVLRHSPEDTGIPLWIYTQYTHFSEMPTLKLGQRVRMVEIIGPTGNSGSGRKGGQSRKRRPAIHFGVFYSTSDQYAVIYDRVIPVDGQCMDPVALFRKKLPLDSHSMKELPKTEKQVPISVMLDSGEIIPDNSKVIWPYTCTRK